nr:MAG TPA: hypothetical protein [Myoviridae sp. ctDdE54]
MTGRLISAGVATKRELDTFYSLQDAMELDEIATLRAYHQWLATKDAGK